MNQHEITVLAEQVAENLDGAWSVEPFPADWGRAGAWLRGEAGESLSFGETQEYSKRNKNLLDVGTDYPKHGDQGFHTKRPRISVSATKTGKQIAADIERRLLPEYRPILQKVLSDLSARESYEKSTSSIAAQIAKLVRVEHSPGERKVSFYHSPYPIFHETMSEAEVIGPDEVELTLRLTPEGVLNILKYVIS